jgi:hypothetical protein
MDFSERPLTISKYDPVLPSGREAGPPGVLSGPDHSNSRISFTRKRATRSDRCDLT